MKKLIFLITFFIPLLVKAQLSGVTPQFKGNSSSNYLQYNWAGKTSGPDTIYNAKFIRSLLGDTIHFSRRFKGNGTAISPVELAIGDSSATPSNNFAVFKNANGDLVLPNINFDLTSNEVRFNGPKIYAISGIKIGSLTNETPSSSVFIKRDNSTGNFMQDTVKYAKLSQVALTYNNGVFKSGSVVSIGGSITSDVTVNVPIGKSFNFLYQDNNFNNASIYLQAGGGSFFETRNVSGPDGFAQMGTNFGGASASPYAFLGWGPGDASNVNQGFFTRNTAGYGNSWGVSILDNQDFAGAAYGSDYSSEGIRLSGDRWITDKGYVDAAIAASGAGSTTNPLTFDDSGSGAASGSTFDGSAAKTLSYNSIGAQPTLVSGTNIKTINSGTLLGSGNILLQTPLTAGTDYIAPTGNGSSLTGLTTAQVAEVSNLYYTSARVLTAPLTGFSSGAGTVSSSDNILQAFQKINGNEVIDASDIASNTTAISGKQATLVSGTNIKTINFGSLLGSGNITLLAPANNLSDLSTVSTARNNLGLPYPGSYQVRNDFFIAWYGDSLTAGGQSNGIPAPTQFSNYSGYSIYNGGIGGELSSQITARITADTARQHHGFIVWMGRNNVISDTTTLKTNWNSFKTLMTSAGNTRYVVLGIIKKRDVTEYTGATNANTIDRMNSYASTLFGSHFVDVNAALVAAYNPAIPQDVVDHGHGVPPSSLHVPTDSLHLSTAGYAVVVANIPLAIFQDATAVVTNNTLRGVGQSIDHVDVSSTYKINGNMAVYMPDQNLYTGVAYLFSGQAGTGFTPNGVPGIAAGAQYDLFGGIYAGGSLTTAAGNVIFSPNGAQLITTGSYNVGMGYNVLPNATTATGITALGKQAGGGIITGTHDIIIGDGLNGLASGLSNKIILGVNAVQTINISAGSTPTANLVLRTGDSGGAADFTVLTVNDLPGSIPNAKLANSSITFNGTPTALGASFTISKSNTDSTLSTGFATRSYAATLLSQANAATTYVPQTRTVGGFALSSNVTFASLTPGVTLKNTSGSNYNASAATTLDIDLSHSNIWTGLPISNTNAVGTGNTDAFENTNTTVAALGAQQNSGSYHWQGNGWNTGSSASQSADAISFLTPIQGSTVTSTLNIAFAVNGGAYTSRYAFGSGGVTGFNGGTFTNKIFNTAAADVPGIVSSTTTASTVSVQVNNTPSTDYLGTAWNLTATAASNVFGWRQLGRGTSGTTPSSTFVWASGLGVTVPTWTDRMTLTSAGLLSTANLNLSGLTASKVVFTDGSKNLTSTGIGTASQLIMGDGSLTLLGAKPHTIFTPTTGGTVNLTNNQYNVINPAGALLALTVSLPSSPANNDCVFIKFTQNITTVTYSNGTVVDGITAPTAGGLIVLTYDSGSTSWY